MCFHLGPIINRSIDRKELLQDAEDLARLTDEAPRPYGGRYFSGFRVGGRKGLNFRLSQRIGTLSVSDDVPAEDIIAAFADSATIGLALTGSYARGEATPWSDVDILRFIQVQSSDEEGLYSLSMLDGKLCSLNTTTIAAKEASSSRPQDAIWTVPALRQTRIILDRTGELGALKQKADDFRWEVLQDPADRYASYTSMD